MLQEGTGEQGKMNIDVSEGQWEWQFLGTTDSFREVLVGKTEWSSVKGVSTPKLQREWMYPVYECSVSVIFEDTRDVINGGV